MKLISILKFIFFHPLNKNNRLFSVIKFIIWQLFNKVYKSKVIIPWVDDTKLIVSKGEAGVTGNLYCGLMEYQDMGFILHFIRSSDLFFDIGANLGVYSVLASGVKGCKSFAFEPIPKTFQKLVEQIKINRLEELVHCINKGISNKNDFLEFTTEFDCMNRVVKNIKNNSVETINAEVIKLDDYHKVDSPTIVKIDVEGYEKFVFDGGKSFFSSPNVLAIIVETNGSGNLYGINDTDLHKQILSFGLFPIIYDIFSRKIIKSNSFNKDANTVYVRDLKEAQNRCKDSKEVRIHTANNFLL